MQSGGGEDAPTRMGACTWKGQTGVSELQLGACAKGSLRPRSNQRRPTGTRFPAWRRRRGAVLIWPVTPARSPAAGGGRIKDSGKSAEQQETRGCKRQTSADIESLDG